MNLEHDVARASTLARLDRIIDGLRSGGTLDDWATDERQWFAALLHPFGRPAAQCRRLSSAERTSRAAGLLLASIVEDLMANGLSSRELLAIVRLYAVLQDAHPTFKEDYAPLVLRLAESMRSYLIDEPVRPGFQDSQEQFA